MMAERFLIHIWDFVDNDGILTPWLLGILSEEVLRMIIEAGSAHQVWPSLEEQLLPMMKEKIVYLKDHQMNLKKRSLITNEYIQKFKTIYDSLTAVNKPVDDGDKEFQLAHRLAIISRLQSSNTSKISMPYILSVQPCKDISKCCPMNKKTRSNFSTMNKPFSIKEEEVEIMRVVLTQGEGFHTNRNEWSLEQ